MSNMVSLVRMKKFCMTMVYHDRRRGLITVLKVVKLVPLNFTGSVFE